MNKVDITNIRPIPKPQMKIIHVLDLEDEKKEAKPTSGRTFIDFVRGLWFSDFANELLYIILRSASLICFALALYFMFGGRL